MKRNPPKAESLDSGTRRLFSYLDGELDPAARTAFEAEAVADPVLAAELRCFRSLFAAMKSMDPVVPPADLEVSVIASLHTRPSALRRLWTWLSNGSAHGPASGAFDAMLDGRLTTRQARALAALAARDAEAARILTGWHRLGRALSRLPEFAPADGFAERVMARACRSRRPDGYELAPVAASEVWWRGADQLAAASGIAFGPAAAVAGIAYMLFANNPLVTLSNLGSFLWNRLQGAFLGVSQGLIDAGARIPAAQGAGAAFRGMVSDPAFLTGILLMAALTSSCAWILYRNIANTAVVNTTVSEHRHAPV